MNIRLTELLGASPAVVLLGPRQVGKTSLALAAGEKRSSLYLALEDAADRAKITDPARYFEEHTDELIILDEVHRVPELFQTLRGVIDLGRRRGRTGGQFLLLGSATLDLLRQSGESLAGRIAYLELGVDAKTVAGYLDLMVDLMLVRRLPSWHRNEGKRFVKAPKVYVRDAGLAHALLGIPNKESLLAHPVVGSSWESFVIENLLSVAPPVRSRIITGPQRGTKSIWSFNCPPYENGIDADRNPLRQCSIHLIIN